MANAKISMSQRARNYPIQASKNGLVGWAGGQCEGYVIGKKALDYAFTCACSRDSLKSRNAMSVKYFFPKFSWRKWLSGLSTSSRLNSDWAQSSNQSYSIHPMRINYSYLTQIVSKALKCRRFFLQIWKWNTLKQCSWIWAVSIARTWFQLYYSRRQTSWKGE